MTLAADVARCLGTDLPECKTCRRRTDPPHERQTWTGPWELEACHASKGYQVTRTAPNRSKIVDMLGLLVRAPRTVDELSELTGMDRTTIHWWLHMLMEEHLIQRKNFGRVARHYRYFWSPPSV
jgi:DNA-binding transcriptional ArsR family regulator